MVIGNGDIAKALIDEGLDRPDMIFMASGVSYSGEVRKKEFDREAQMINGLGLKNHIVYFSSLCIYYSNSAYATHKQTMEWRLINGGFKSYTLVRLGNISWGHNPNTIINYFKNEHDAGRTPLLQDAYRHIISREEFVYWMKNIRPGINDIMNIPGEMVSINEIWRRVQNGEY